MANPLIQQGVLNRLRGTVAFVNYPQLNVTPSYLGREGIRLSFGGAATARFGTMTGAVTSPEPYQDCTLTIHLLKTQSFAQLWETQRQTNAVLGPCTVNPDVSTLAPYDLYNTSIENVGELNFAGEDPGYVVTIGGYFLINNNLWS